MEKFVKFESGRTENIPRSQQFDRTQILKTIKIESIQIPTKHFCLSVFLLLVRFSCNVCYSTQVDL